MGQSFDIFQTFDPLKSDPSLTYHEREDRTFRTQRLVQGPQTVRMTAP